MAESIPTNESQAVPTATNKPQTTITAETPLTTPVAPVTTGEPLTVPLTTTKEPLTSPITTPTTPTPSEAKISDITTPPTEKQPNIFSKLFHRIGLVLRGDGIATEENDLLGHKSKLEQSGLINPPSDYDPLPPDKK